jgi:alanyl-tRNA synthetase
MTTERLYYSDSYLREFTARVVRRTDHGVVLDRTAFYPAGGGQPCDLGTLNGVPVTDVVEEGDDVIHAVASPLEGEVRGVVDADRRRDHMQQHHGQHLLSEAFLVVAGAQTASFHLGREASTIDLDRAVSPEKAAEAEDMANRAVWDNRPVETAFHLLEEARKLPMRKPPPEQPRIRVVTVKDYDCQACCGTHPRSTGEVGSILVTAVERLKEGSRIHFVCGGRAVRESRENVRVLRAAGAKLSAGRGDLEKAVDRVLEESAATRRRLNQGEKKLAEYLGRELAARGRVVTEVFEDRGIEYLRMLATQIAAQPGKVAILGGTGETSSLVIARSPDVALDLRPLFKEALAVIEGKGGGPANFVQGGGPGKDVRSAVRRAEEKVVANLGA